MPFSIVAPTDPPPPPRSTIYNNRPLAHRQFPRYHLQYRESVPESEGFHSADNPEGERDDESHIQAPSEPPKPPTNHCVTEKAHTATQPAAPSLLAAASPLSTPPQSIPANRLGSDILPRQKRGQQQHQQHQQQRLHQIQHRTSPPPPPPSRPSHAEEQQMLHNAERKLAKPLGGK
ncbi:hypothetical protein BDN72DRAFT_899545 [Pluteus cervinus]|uniref:Uncharacterized protein n=1 Tax=Pluteus cervinus TaxID=181527 RepID=A0ACD3AMB0_9AGAR|nr:hypothetical protein BDN72DRAFT_899545 [Pluteus cervinus]